MTDNTTPNLTLDEPAAPSLTLEQQAPAAPGLTLDAAPEQQAEQPAEAPKPLDADAMAEESGLSPEEKQQVEDFAKKIDLSNSTQILQYGAASQKKVADFSTSALENIRTKDLGEVGDMVTGLITELKGFDATAEQPKGIFGWFKKAGNQVEELKLRYSKAETNVDKIESMLQDHQVQLLKDISMLDTMYERNLVYFKELTMYIIAGKKKLEQVRAEDLPKLVEKAQKSGLPEDAQAAKDLEDQCTRFEKKLYDLELTRNISVQMSPQIRLIQSNDTMMAEKIQTSIVNTIPLWKSQMVLALGVEHSSQAAAAQRQVTDMTNELLRKNAEKLKMATVDTARESERGIVDMETLKATNESLISTLDEVMNIQKEGRQKRQEAEAELRAMEQDLKTKLLQIQG